MVVHLGPAVADGVGFFQEGAMGGSLQPWHRKSWRSGGPCCRILQARYNRCRLLEWRVGLVCVPLTCQRGKTFLRGGGGPEVPVVFFWGTLFLELFPQILRLKKKGLSVLLDDVYSRVLVTH